ncbi:MAG: CDP-diacylglycerol--glycerol-3-phosphate 3-phosphatidyltransferase [Ruminococcaceae bacterium]|nr:CDP-diacylglycerol--glycerol-3-phosphate 3-phosphatidyltransferase [Oscillospiraceae bacterium]
MNLPNKITIARIMLIPFFMFTLLAREIFGPDNAFIMDIISAMLFIIASATDGVDGYIARKNNQVTDFGKFLDPIADKLLVAAALISLVELGRIPAYMVFIILAREFIVTGLRIIAVQNGIVLAAEMTGKIKTVIQIIATVICILFASEKFNLFGISICHIAMGIATLFTIYSGYVYLRNNWKLIANAK